jgi:hypothetical protein
MVAAGVTMGITVLLALNLYRFELHKPAGSTAPIPEPVQPVPGEGG